MCLYSKLLSRCWPPIPRLNAVVAIVFLALVTMLGLAPTRQGMAADAVSQNGFNPSSPLTIVVPIVDSERGRRLFVTKGCVICHSVQGFGGQAAPALDAEDGSLAIDVLGFAARMWRGAVAMLKLQQIELGYQIRLGAQEIGDLAAFAADPSEQAKFSLEQIPEPLRDWVLEEPYWQDENWPDELLEQYFDFDGEEKL